MANTNTGKLKENLAKTVFDIANARISQVKTKLQEEHFATILELVDNINSLTRYDFNLNGVPFSEIYVPKFAVPFIFPRSVQLCSADPLGPDLVLRPDKDPNYKYDSAKIFQTADIISQAAREGKAVLTQLSEVKREDKTVGNFCEEFSVAGYVHADNYTHFPTPLLDELDNFIGDNLCNTSIEQYLEHYLRLNFHPFVGDRGEM